MSISKAEIDNKALKLEIHSSDVQRDYVFGWILNAIFTQSNLKDTIFLKGGNALRKGYFQNTRYSNDLDLGIEYDIGIEELGKEIDLLSDYISKNTGVEFFKEEKIIKEKFTLETTPLPDLKVYDIRVYFKDFYSEKSSMKIKVTMDLTRYDKILCPVQEVKLIHDYSDKDKIKCSIRCMKLEEIIASKMKCLLQRQHAPDLFDYVHSIKLLGEDLNSGEVTRLLIKKTIFDKNPNVLKEILKNISKSYFREYWLKTIVCAKSLHFDIEEALEVFVGSLEKMFSMYPDNGYGRYTYFGATLRNPIIEAGRKQNLLRITYNGAVRLVEPYSLKYLQKRDGTAREYLYVYNVSGGSNPPGIRMLVPENFQDIAITEDKFEPREQIELCKAGELPENPYLFDPNKPTKSSRQWRSRSSRSRETKYVYKCASCGKRFYRKSRNNKINKHKNKSGFDCYGNYGVYVGTKY